MTFQKTTGAETPAGEKDYLYYWQLWHHNWDDGDIALAKEQLSLAGKQVLEVGCGDGRLALGLAPECERVVGVDLNEEFIKAANERLQAAVENNAQFKVMNAEKLDFPDDTFDAVLFPWVLQMVTNPVDAVVEAQRVLKPGGSLLIIGLLSDADYDHIIAKFAPTGGPIDQLRCYEKPLAAAFSANSASIVSLGVRKFDYYFESLDIAFDAFIFALDRWYATTLEETGRDELRKMLEGLLIGDRVRLQFPCVVYLAHKPAAPASEAS